jgi:hypothetical protein
VLTTLRTAEEIRGIDEAGRLASPDDGDARLKERRVQQKEGRRI